MYTSGPRPDALANSKTQAYLAVSIVFPIICTGFIAGMLYCRRWEKVSLRIQDWLLIVALILFYGLSATNFVGVTSHFGSPVEYISLNEELRIAKLTVVVMMFWGTIVTFCRCAIALTFIDLFWRNLYRRLAYAILAIDVLWGLVVILIMPLRCNPPSKAFNPLVHACDFITWVLSIPLVWGLRMSPKDRIGVVAIFSLGLLIVVLDVIIVITEFNLSLDNYQTKGVLGAIMGYTQDAVVMMATCGIAMRPLFDRWWEVSGAPERFLLASQPVISESASGFSARGTKADEHDAYFVHASRPHWRQTRIEVLPRSTRRPQRQPSNASGIAIEVQQEFSVEHHSQDNV